MVHGFISSEIRTTRLARVAGRYSGRVEALLAFHVLLFDKEQSGVILRVLLLNKYLAQQ